MIELILKPAPLYGAWNGYILISEDEKYYQKVIDEYNTMCVDAMNNCLDDMYPDLPSLTEACQVHGSSEETTFAKLLDAKKASQFMGKQVYEKGLVIGFDTLHSWDTPETQKKETVLERTKAWRDQLLANME